MANTESVGLQLVEEKAVPLDTEVFPRVDSFVFANNILVSQFCFQSNGFAECLILVSQVDKDLSVLTLDGVPSSGFVTRATKSTLYLTGRKTFNQTVSMNHTFTLLYHLNGYELRELWNSTLRIEGNQTIPGSLLINNDVDVVK